MGIIRQRSLTDRHVRKRESERKGEREWRRESEREKARERKRESEKERARERA